ncbi:MAG TPA: type II toxin-antitoxin system VapC family toxin [Phycisphaerae bacterium]|nr:type II toxin-antitoxin system VapC family toxin [Phycisphaerae bacterium]
MRKLRVYADTSVFGGAFDEEFEEPTARFFEQVRLGRFELVSSGVVQAEMEPAPEQVKNLFAETLPLAEIVDVTDEALALRNAYIEAGIVSGQWANDALHVALATVSACAVIVSWNFKHIVHYRKIALYNGVNGSLGYAALGIYSPREVIEYEDQDV